MATIDYSARTDECEYFDPLTEDQKARARLTVCRSAVGATLAEQVADAAELMFALGIHPSQAGEDY
jgi:hypothetical protein